MSNSRSAPIGDVGAAKIVRSQDDAPTRAAAPVTLALRTQQVLAFETGVTNTVDPLGGSYFVESLTMQMRDQAKKYFAEIARRGP